MLFLSGEQIVAWLSNTDEQGLPITSELTSSFENAYWICSTRFPFRAYLRMISFTSSLEVSRLMVMFRMARETLGVGTRTEFAVNLPESCGSTFFKALSAPFSVITIFIAAERPRRYFLW